MSSTPGGSAESLRLLVIDPGRELEALTRRLAEQGAGVVAAVADIAEAGHQISSFRPNVIIARHRFADRPADCEELARMVQNADVPPLVVLWGDRAFGQEWRSDGQRDWLVLDGLSEEQVAANLAVIARLATAAPWAAGAGGESERLRWRLDHALKLVGEAEVRLKTALDGSRAARPPGGDALAQLMHELRTPLNAILGYAEILKTELLGPLGHDKYRDHATTIHEAASHLLALANRHLTMARAEADLDALQITDVKVAALIQSMERLFAGQAAKKGVKLVALTEENLPTVRTDETKLRQILINLISNAINFTPRGGRVSVIARSESEEGVAVFIISDTGVGMTANDLVQAMEPWTQIEEGATHGGSGLGLPIVEKIVRRLGGTLELRSNVTVGTTAIVRLPLAGPPSL